MQVPFQDSFNYFPIFNMTSLLSNDDNLVSIPIRTNKNNDAVDPVSIAFISRSSRKDAPISSSMNMVVMRQLKCVTLEEDNDFSWKAQFLASL